MDGVRVNRMGVCLEPCRNEKKSLNSGSFYLLDDGRIDPLENN